MPMPAILIWQIRAKLKRESSLFQLINLHIRDDIVT